MFTSIKSEYESLSPSDSEFTFVDGVSVVPRASILVDKSCPYGYAQIIAQALEKGYIKPVANVEKSTLTLVRLKK